MRSRSLSPPHAGAEEGNASELWGSQVRCVCQVGTSRQFNRRFELCELNDASPGHETIYKPVEWKSQGGVVVTMPVARRRD